MKTATTPKDTLKDQELESIKKELETMKYHSYEKDCIIESKDQLIKDLETVLNLQGNIKLNEQQINNFIFGFGVNSENRLERFYFWSKYLSPYLYWEYLSVAYTCSDNLYKYKGQVKELFSSTLPGREKLMTAKEQDYYNALPDTLTIYRAMTIKESLSKDYGISWTLDKNVAEYYMVIYNRNHTARNEPKTIIELQIKKNDAIAFLTGRKEAEIIYLNKNN